MITPCFATINEGLHDRKTTLASKQGFHLLEDLVDVDLEGFDLGFALFLSTSLGGLGHLLCGLLLCLGRHDSLSTAPTLC